MTEEKLSRKRRVQVLLENLDDDDSDIRIDNALDDASSRKNYLGSEVEMFESEPSHQNAGEFVELENNSPVKKEVSAPVSKRFSKKSRVRNVFKNFVKKHQLGTTKKDPYGLQKPVYNAQVNGDPREYSILGIPVKFPFTAYPSQLQVMSGIVSALKKRENALLESPTGTGKTLALLCAALSWQEWHYQQELNSPSSSASTTAAESLTAKSEDDSVKMKEMLRLLHSHRYEDAPSDVLNPSASKVEKVKLYVCSRTQKQVAQIVNEMRAKTPFRPKLTVLGSKTHYCINSKLSNATNKNDECRKLLKENACRSYGNSDLAGIAVREPESDGLPGVWDMEDLIQIGKSLNACPYFASRSLQVSSDIIFCPYNYIVDPVIRKAADIRLENSVIIVDEAHNIEDVCREASSCELAEGLLEMARSEILEQSISVGSSKRASSQLVLDFLHQLRRWMLAHMNDAMETDFDTGRVIWHGRREITKQLEDMGLTSGIEQRLKNALEDLSSSSDSKNNSEPVPTLSGGVAGMLSSFVNVLQNLFALNHWESFKLVLIKHKDYATSSHFASAVTSSDGVNGDAFNTAYALTDSTRYLQRLQSGAEFSIGFWCLDPGVAFREVSQLTRSVVLTSGTLSPFTSFAGELKSTFAFQCEGKHVAKPDQIWVGSILRGSDGQLLEGTYKNAISFSYQDSLGSILLQVASTVPDGVLVFLPSYLQLTRLIDRWTSTGLFTKLNNTKRIFMEERAGSTKFETMLEDYKSAISNGNGAMLFGIYRGKLSEGIDFSDEMARCVIAVGIPFPNMKDPKVQYKQAYNDSIHGKNQNACLSGRQWYGIQAYRALNQAIGRCIRHRDDWGAILFLESRMQQPSKIQNLSKWIRNYAVNYDTFSTASASLTEFCSRQRSRSLGFLQTGPSDFATCDADTCPKVSQQDCSAKELKL